MMNGTQDWDGTSADSGVGKYGTCCVELDIWDGEDGEPKVYHGHTWVGRLRLADVLESIARYAFTRSKVLARRFASARASTRF